MKELVEIASHEWALLIVGSACAGVGWWIRRELANIGDVMDSLRAADKDVSDRLRALEVQLPREYLPRDDARALFDTVNRNIGDLRVDMVTEIRRLGDKLDSKADKQ